MNVSVYVGVILAVVLAIFINWPAPPLSSSLKQFQQDGKWFQYKDQRIFYIDNVGQGPTEDVIFLIHGFPTSSYDWLKIWDELRVKFGRLVAFDMLGFGFSDKPYGRNYTIFEQADIAEALLAHLKLSRVHILAHDYGDTVAQELLHRHGERRKENTNEKSYLHFQTVCLLNGGIFPETHIPRWSQNLLLNSYFRNIFAYLSNYWLFTKELSSTFGELTKPTKEDLNEWWALFRHNDGHYILPNLMQYIAQRRANRHRWVNALQNTKVPLHFVYGPLDPINPHPAFLQRFRTLLPLATIDSLENVGHYVQWEAPQQMIDSYFQFLNTHTNN